MSDPAPKKPGRPMSHGGVVFDVKRPGKTPSQPTSRPVIVGHKSVVRDPFTTGKANVHDPTKQKVAPVPLSQRPQLSDSMPAAKISDAASPELAAIAAELATQPESVKQVPEPPESKPESQSANVITTSVNSVLSDPIKDVVPGATTPLIPAEPEKKQSSLSPELKKQMDQVLQDNPVGPEPEGVTVSGDHGPINFMKVLLWFVSVIVLVVVVGDVLLDAGAITTTVNIPHTHFIK